MNVSIYKNIIRRLIQDMMQPQDISTNVAGRVGFIA